MMGWWAVMSRTSLWMTTRALSAHTLFPEAVVRRTAETAGNVRVVCGDDIIVRAIRILRCHAGAAIALIQIAVACTVVVVAVVGAVVTAGRFVAFSGCRFSARSLR